MAELSVDSLPMPNVPEPCDLVVSMQSHPPVAMGRRLLGAINAVGRELQFGINRASNRNSYPTGYSGHGHGVTPKFWRIGDIVTWLEEAAPPPGPTGPYRKQF